MKSKVKRQKKGSLVSRNRIVLHAACSWPKVIISLSLSSPSSSSSFPLSSLPRFYLSIPLFCFFLMLLYSIVCYSYVTSHRDRFHSACGKRRHFTSHRKEASNWQHKGAGRPLPSSPLVLPFVPCRKLEKNGK